MVVRRRHGRPREGLREQHRRRPQPAADVGDPAAGAQLVLDAVERGQPGRDEVRGVAGAEQQLAAEEHVVVVLVPAHPGTGAEGLGDPRLGAQRAEGEHEGARQVERARRVGEGERLLGGEVERAGRRVVLDVAACGLPGQPLGDVTRVGAGAPASSSGVAGALREGRVEPEAVPDDDTAGGGRRAEVADHAPEQGVEPVGVDLRRGLSGAVGPVIVCSVRLWVRRVRPASSPPLRGGCAAAAR